MRRVLALSALGLTILTCHHRRWRTTVRTSSPAFIRAAATAAPPAGGGLGGGFVEFLLTGKTDGAPRRDAPPAPRRRRTRRPTRRRARDSSSASTRRRGRTTRRSRRRRKRASPPSRRRSSAARKSTTQHASGPARIVIDTPNKFLYLVEPGGKALRYGVGVGRPGFEWAGVKSVSRKAEWPGWTPPAEMMKRRPDLPAHMDGGAGNPLGARALYLGSSMYRIHGTNEPWTIGQSVSSGCIRMMNDDVIDLYERVKVGTKVIVIEA